MSITVERYVTPWNIEHERGVRPALARFEALNAGMDKLRDENAKLRESNDMLAKMLGDRTADCYKLRELVRDLHYCCSSNDRCHPCPYFSADIECPEPHFSERMRELGIEVSE